jgi:cytidine deaminase
MDHDDTLLLRTAQELLARTHVPGRHEVAAALRTRSGAVYTGVHLQGSAGRTSICAEGVALGAALTAGDADVTAIVAVQFKPAGVFRVISPCGVCRDLLCDYCPDATIHVYVPGPDEGATDPATGTVERARVIDLLPAKTRRRW